MDKALYYHIHDVHKYFDRDLLRSFLFTLVTIISGTPSFRIVCI